MIFRLMLLLSLIVPTIARGQGSAADYERMKNIDRVFANKVIGENIRPVWFANGQGVWYRLDLPGGQRRFFIADAKAGKVDHAFDHAAFAKSLATASKRTVDANKLPVDQIELHDKGLLVRAAGKFWLWDTKAGTLTQAEAPPRAPKPKKKHHDRGFHPPGMGTRSSNRSPDGNWTVRIKDHNLFIQEKGDDTPIALTNDGTEKNPYAGGYWWSPDSNRLVCMRKTHGEKRLVYLIESSPKDQLQPKLHSYNYRKPGDAIPQQWPHLFDIESKKQIPLDRSLFNNPWTLNSIRWEADSSRFCFYYNQRGHEVVRIVAVDRNGKASALINEQPGTFVDYAHKTFIYWIKETDEIIWMSERDGWNHLYLFDGRTGKLKNQITRGEWVVRRVDHVDLEKRVIHFRAMSVHPGQDPYHVHHCRIGFDGKGLVKLTDGDGTHSLEFSTQGEYYLDRYSRVDMPQVIELRRTSDGKRMCIVAKADARAMAKEGLLPERFVARGRDGTTDIYGIILRPTNFDPDKRYPVIENIYAGPHGYFVPKHFSRFHGNSQRMAELGFIVVRIDGMGTNWRSKAFHDVCWKNVGDSGFPDRVAWMKAAAKTRPWMDISRVGIYGGSAGGQSALRGMLAHGDFYKAAVADCGCHDNRMDKIWWNEAWMGYPVGPHYKEQSNVTQAHKLTGKLMLVVGELDRNVDPASTTQVVHALIKANKDFDFLLMVGAGHGAAESSYGKRRRQDFFVRHLWGKEPRH